MGYDNNSSRGWDLPVGFVLGILLGALGGILFAPKPGKEFQGDVQDFVNTLPDNLNALTAQSKVRYTEILAKSKFGLEQQLEKLQERKKAVRIAQAKQRETQDQEHYEFQ